LIGWESTLNFKSFEDWYNVTKRDINKYGGSGILSNYNNSLVNALLSVYPDFDWIIWKFNQNTVPQEFWNDKKNQKKFFDWVGEQFRFKSFEDWYNITLEDINKHGGHRALFYYNNYPANALLSVYPDFDWIVWKFCRRNHIKFIMQNNDEESISELLSAISEKLLVSNLNDWYRVSRNILRGTGFPIENRIELMALLSKVYPNHKWHEETFLIKQNRSSQWMLFKTVQNIFPPAVDIIEEYQFPATNYIAHSMIFDIFVPAYNIIFEYQGYQHYHSTGYFGDAKFLKKQDNEKREACDYYDITYLEVPYWWQYTKESIITLIHQARPDIMLTHQ